MEVIKAKVLNYLPRAGKGNKERSEGDGKKEASAGRTVKKECWDR